MTPNTTPITISEEARAAELDIIRQLFTDEHTVRNALEKDGFVGIIIQLAINSSTEKLIAENERLRKMNMELNGRIGYLEGMLAGIQHWDVPRELKDRILLNLGFHKIPTNTNQGEQER